jgi:hypothetical protein
MGLSSRDARLRDPVATGVRLMSLKLFIEGIEKAEGEKPKKRKGFVEEAEKRRHETIKL